MVRQITTISDAAHEWVREFNAVPLGMISKLMSQDIDEWTEVTMPSIGNQVYVYCEEETGEITGITENEDGEKIYEVTLYDDRVVDVDDSELDVERDDLLPMWGTMWSFGDTCDDWWLEEDDGIEIMSECGFRVYESDYGYFFGIDGAGYDFYEAHWIPLYKKRGLKWHDENEDGDGKE